MAWVAIPLPREEEEDYGYDRGLINSGCVSKRDKYCHCGSVKGYLYVGGGRRFVSANAVLSFHHYIYCICVHRNSACVSCVTKICTP